MPNRNDALFEATYKVANLQGRLEEKERSRDELKRLLDAMQDDLDLMRERSVRAETLYAEARKTLDVLEKL